MKKLSGAKNKKILVVDDEEEIVASLKHILTRANFEVICTTRGQEAIELTRVKKPDLIILDIILPDISGGDIASILSGDTATANIPIIFLTALINKDEEFLAKKEGGVETGRRYIIAKPIIKEDLLKIINEAIPN